MGSIRIFIISQNLLFVIISHFFGLLLHAIGDIKCLFCDIKCWFCDMWQCCIWLQNKLYTAISNDIVASIYQCYYNYCYHLTYSRTLLHIPCCSTISQYAAWMLTLLPRYSVLIAWSVLFSSCYELINSSNYLYY